MEIKKVWSVNCLLCWKTKWRRCPPAPISPMSARCLQKNSSSFWNSLSPTASSASTRNSIKYYRVQPWVHLSPHHCKYLYWILWILSYSLITNINQLVVQVCWWCQHCHQERSNQQTSRAPQFLRYTHQIYYRTPWNRWSPLPRYPDQTHC